MNTKEFRKFNGTFIRELEVKLKPIKASCKVLLQEPHQAKMLIGIWYNESPSFVEIYELYNDGDKAIWKFKGVK